MTQGTDYDPTYDEPRPDNPIARPTTYTVTCLPEHVPDADVWTLTVEHRGKGRWVVKHHDAILGRNGTWDFGGIPEEGRDAWIAEHFFPLDEALELAKQAAPKFTRGGMTPADVLAWHAAGCPAPIPRPHAKSAGQPTEEDAGQCPACRGTGVRQVADPIDLEFVGEEPCARCDGTGRVDDEHAEGALR